MKPFLVFLATILTSCSSSPQPAWAEVGTASYYGNGEKLNRQTANGEVFDPTALTCAKWDVPFGTRLKVTNLANEKAVVVRCTDRGPAKRLRRVIDLSREAFKKISPLRKGVIRVNVERLYN